MNTASGAPGAFVGRTIPDSQATVRETPCLWVTPHKAGDNVASEPVLASHRATNDDATGVRAGPSGLLVTRIDPPGTSCARRRAKSRVERAPALDHYYCRGLASMATRRLTMARSRVGGSPTKQTGQQSGSKRPAPRTGAAVVAPKKGTVAAKGTRRAGAARKTRAGKTGGSRPVRAKKR
jgi:hypothetical protein